ncbi:hypothetical protein L9F63_005839, partial [Diploptera punctata]
QLFKLQQWNKTKHWKWRKRLLEMGRMQKIKPPGRPRISTDAETTKRIVEAQSSVCLVSKCEKYHSFKPIRVHELNEDYPD